MLRKTRKNSNLEQKAPRRIATEKANTKRYSKHFASNCKALNKHCKELTIRIKTQIHSCRQVQIQQTNKQDIRKHHLCF